jgi:hypothetical protein
MKKKRSYVDRITGVPVHAQSKHASAPKPVRATSAVSKELHSLRGQRMMLMRVIASLVTRNVQMQRGVAEEDAIDSSMHVDISFTELNTACEIGMSVIPSGHRRDAMMRVFVSDQKSAPADMEKTVIDLLGPPPA